MTDAPSTCRLRRIDASAYLQKKFGVSRTPKTLAKLAVTGGGPAYQKDGRFPLYLKDDLDDWVQSQLSPLVTSTAELLALKRGRKS